MRRRRQPLRVSTFPFLAVLLCAMGALLFVLLAMDRKARQAVQAKAQEEARQHLDDQVKLLTARRSEYESRKRALQQVWETKRDALLARVGAEESALQRELREVQARLAKVARRVQDEEGNVTKLRQQLQNEQARILAQKQALASARQEAVNVTARKLSTDQAKARLTDQLLHLEQSLKTMRQERKNDSHTYSVIPYFGKRGQSRRPLYLECAAGGVLFHPDKLQLDAGSDSARVGSELLRRANIQCQRMVAEGAKDTRPYVMLLVRPDGIGCYYRMQSILHELSLEFGYEFVDADWILKVPEEGPPPPPLLASQQAGSRPLTLQQPAGAPAGQRSGGPGSGTGLAGQGSGGTGSGLGMPGTSNLPGIGHAPNMGMGIAFRPPSIDGSGRTDGQSATPLSTVPSGQSKPGAPIGSGTPAGGPTAAGGLGWTRGGTGAIPGALPGVPGGPGGSGTTRVAMASSDVPGNGPFSSGSSGSGTKAAGPAGFGSGPPTSEGTANGQGSGSARTGSVQSPGPLAGTSRSASSDSDGSSQPATNAMPGGLASDPGGEPVTVIVPPSILPTTSSGGGPPSSPSAPSSGPPPPPLGSSPPLPPAKAPSTTTSPDARALAQPGTPGGTLPAGGGRPGRGTAEGASFAPPPPVPERRPATLRPALVGNDGTYVIFVECLSEYVVMYPSRLRVPIDKLNHSPGFNPLFKTIEQMIARRLSTLRPGEKPPHIQVRFLVHADGERTLHLAYPVLNELQIEKVRYSLQPEDDVNRIIAIY